MTALTRGGAGNPGLGSPDEVQGGDEGIRDREPSTTPPSPRSPGSSFSSPESPRVGEVKLRQSNGRLPGTAGAEQAQDAARVGHMRPSTRSILDWSETFREDALRSRGKKDTCAITSSASTSQASTARPVLRNRTAAGLNLKAPTTATIQRKAFEEEKHRNEAGSEEGTRERDVTEMSSRKKSDMKRRQDRRALSEGDEKKDGQIKIWEKDLHSKGETEVREVVACA